MPVRLPWVALSCASFDAARSDNFPMNFALEVFALHVRNLLDFFAPENERPTDVCAHRFCKEWEPPKVEKDLYLKDVRWTANKQIAHLTTDRTADPNLKEWAVEPITYSLIPIIRRFAGEAELICDDFRQDVYDI